MKANILLNYYNFDGDWARETLAPFVKGRVLIVPLAYREHDIFDNQSWQSVYGVGGEKYDNIMRPFYAYGIAKQNISWLNFFDEQADHLAEVQNADMLFFTGGMPEKAIARLQLLGLTEAVQNFDGVVAGASAGAMFQLARYHVTPDEDYADYGLWQGLGLVDGFDLEVHYLDTDLQNACTRRAIADLDVPVYQMWHEGGLLVVDGVVRSMGNVVKVTK